MSVNISVQLLDRLINLFKLFRSLSDHVRVQHDLLNLILRHAL